LDENIKEIKNILKVLNNAPISVKEISKLKTLGEEDREEVLVSANLRDTRVIRGRALMIEWIMMKFLSEISDDGYSFNIVSRWRF
jgi:hypothetical protein